MNYNYFYTRYCTLKTCSLKDIQLDNLLNLFTETLGEIYTIVLNFVQVELLKMSNNSTIY